MKTKVIMKRELFGTDIGQCSQTGFFDITALFKAGNKWRAINDLPSINMHGLLNTQESKEFINELAITFNCIPLKKGRGRGAVIWGHPLLFIDLALKISPKLKIQVYQWLYDELIKYRNASGDSYKKMCGALYVNSKAPCKFALEIKSIASKIQEACRVTDWQKATEEQLKTRDKIHENIILLSSVLKDNEHVVDIAILKAKE